MQELQKLGVLIKQQHYQLEVLPLERVNANLYPLEAGGPVHANTHSTTGCANLSKGPGLRSRGVRMLLPHDECELDQIGAIGLSEYTMSGYGPGRGMMKRLIFLGTRLMVV
jgi:hypothetical protein